MTIRPIQTSLARDRHAYTHSKVPWLITAGGSAYGRMIKYLSGGGLQSFGRTLEQEKTYSRQQRFLVLSGVIAVIWLVFYIF